MHKSKRSWLRAVGVGLMSLVVVLTPTVALATHGNETLLRFRGDLYPTAEGTFTKPIASLPGGVLNGRVVWTGTDGCTLDDISEATSPNQIALFQRGICAFTTKAQNAQNKGYKAFVVANHATGGDTIVTMGGSVDVDIPGVFVGYSTGEIMKRASPNGSLNVHAAAE